MADYRRGYRDDYGQQNRYSGSYGNDRDDYGRSYRGDRGYRDDRGAMDRAGDEIQSWFGDDDAERRRRMDERRDPDTNHFGGRDLLTKVGQQVFRLIDNTAIVDRFVGPTPVELDLEVPKFGSLDSRLIGGRLNICAAKPFAHDVRGALHVERPELDLHSDTALAGQTQSTVTF